MEIESDLEYLEVSLQERRIHLHNWVSVDVDLIYIEGGHCKGYRSDRFYPFL